ncbi:24384_t:CDS:1 [Gigaspora margarita]|uniref:24384_t:CDS:1 n=1 Tax=Gigaspora margarita TaxID=4874 RepID=A0ABN7WE03_GIGMA|nr:24384_t:CDS:1 [Gigaspora margarita]
MRVNNDLGANEFKNFLLRIGNGTEETVNNDMICIPNNMVINWNNEQSLQTLIKQVYPHLSIHSSNALYFADKAILTTKNEYVDHINNTILNQLPNEGIQFKGFDSVPDDIHNLY